MKGKTILIVLVAVLATAASTIVATRAITGSVQDGRIVAASAETDPGEIENKVSEVAVLVEDIEASSDKEAVTRDDRDPMVKYKSKPKPVQKPPSEPTSTQPSVPSWPSYTVTAVLSGGVDTRAFLKLGGESINVKVGDEIKGGRVIAIEPDGVTIEGEAGSRFYPF